MYFGRILSRRCACVFESQIKYKDMNSRQVCFDTLEKKIRKSTYSPLAFITKTALRIVVCD